MFLFRQFFLLLIHNFNLLFRQYFAMAQTGSLPIMMSFLHIDTKIPVISVFVKVSKNHS